MKQGMELHTDMTPTMEMQLEELQALEHTHYIIDSLLIAGVRTVVKERATSLIAEGKLYPRIQEERNLRKRRRLTNQAISAVTRIVLSDLLPDLVQIVHKDPTLQSGADQVRRLVEENFLRPRKQTRETPDDEKVRKRILRHFDMSEHLGNFEALELVRSAQPIIARLEHVPQIGLLYQHYQDIAEWDKLAAGDVAGFKKSSRSGIFLKGFEEYEGERLPLLVQRRESREQYDHRTQREKKFDVETAVPLLLIHPATGEIIAVAIHTIPPIDPKKDPEYLESKASLIRKLRFDQNRHGLADEIEAGRVGMLWLILAKHDVPFAATLAQYLSLKEVLTLRPDLTHMETYFLNDIVYKQGEYLRRQAVALDNPASGALLHKTGYTHICELDDPDLQEAIDVYGLADPPRPMDAFLPIERKWGVWNHVSAPTQELLQKSGADCSELSRAFDASKTLGPLVDQLDSPQE